LDVFRLLNVAANVNARDFVTVLEKLTDAAGLEEVPVCHPGFREQWG